jgi:hypothetical protein
MVGSSERALGAHTLALACQVNAMADVGEETANRFHVHSPFADEFLRRWIGDTFAGSAGCCDALISANRL